MTTDLLLPQFLGIGAVKAGTTWLHRNLYEHPGLYLPIQKPIFFWDRHRERGLEGYSRIFEPGRELLRGEFTASYSVLQPVVKDELRQLARAQLKKAVVGETWQPTALVNEAWLRMVGRDEEAWENRRHFFFAAARAMHDILVEEARRRATKKRGGGWISWST